MGGVDVGLIPYSQIDHDRDFDHVVVWNGTRAAACGSAYLAATEEPPKRQPAPVIEIHPVPARIEQALQTHGPLTLAALAKALGRMPKDVRGDLQAMVASRVVGVVGKIPQHGRVFARRHHNVYGLTGGAA
jgi:hypothetical protein